MTYLSNNWIQRQCIKNVQLHAETKVNVFMDNVCAYLLMLVIIVNILSNLNMVLPIIKWLFYVFFALFWELLLL